MSRNAEKNVEAAKDLEIRLIVEGRNADADIIQKLRRSRAATQAALKTIFRDNMKLRRQLGLEAFDLGDADG